MAARRKVMTVAEYVPLAMDNLAPTTVRSWTSYARLLIDELGDTPLDAVRRSDIERLARRVESNATRRTVNRNGASAREGFISCARAVWSVAEGDKLVTTNPAQAVKKPKRRRAVPRRALSNAEVQTVWNALSAHSADPELACLVFRLALETGFRRGEMLGLTTRSLDPMSDWVRTGEQAKMHSYRSQPVTPLLMTALREFAASRHDPSSRGAKQLLVNRKGTPITRRWFENTSALVRKHHPELGNPNSVWFTWHLCRHTGATLVERQAGYSMAEKFLGHLGGGRGVTADYTQVTPEELRLVVLRIWQPGGWDLT